MTKKEGLLQRIEKLPRLGIAGNLSPYDVEEAINKTIAKIEKMRSGGSGYTSYNLLMIEAEKVLNLLDSKRRSGE